MKKFLLLPFLTLAVATSFGQCDKNVTLAVSKTEYLDRNGTVQRTVDENSTIEISSSEITIIPGGNADQKMTGKVQSNTCSWTIPYKEGKSVMKARFVDPGGNQQNTTLTLEGAAGKITFLMEVDEMPDRRIRVNVDSFEEKK
ncbi:hypothetical protein GCM10027347_49570 [Larkinella harenae]